MLQSTKIIILISFVTSIGVTFATLFFLLNYNHNVNIVEALLNFFGVLMGGIIGGYVAYLASNMQIKANNELEKKRELKKEFSACLITEENLRTIKNWLSKFEEDTTFINVSKYIDIHSLENFKNNYLYLLNENQSSKFCSTLNRLKLITIRANESVFKLEKIHSLITHIDEVEKLINSRKTKLKKELM